MSHTEYCRLCVNCSHHTDLGFKLLHGCDANYVNQSIPKSPVTGEKMRSVRYDFCSEMRRIDGQCGPEGTLFEEREPSSIEKVVIRLRSLFS